MEGKFISPSRFYFLKRSYISRIIEKLSKQNFFIPVLNFLGLDSHLIFLVEPEKIVAKNNELPEVINLK